MFVPVRITKEEYADKFLDGEVYMNPLNEFGVWGRDKNRGNSDIDNDFRGDLLEGAVSVAADSTKCKQLRGADPSFIEHVHNVTMIDDYEAKYFKILSLYCLDYNPFTNGFVRPDERMKAFGDTAVVITDINEFLRRVCLASVKQYAHSIFLMNRVTFFDDSETRDINAIFEKNKSYAYQKELRIAMCELETNRFARINEGEEIPMSLVWDLNPIKLNIGSIRDIAFKLQMVDFINMRGLYNHKYRWPHTPKGETIYDKIVADTREQIAEGFYSPVQRMLFTFY